MNRFGALLLLLAAFVAAPLSVHAADSLPIFSPGWHIVPDAHDLDSSCPVGAPLSFGGVLRILQNAMNAMVSLGVLIAVLVIVYAGIMFMLTPTNPEGHSQAKKMLTNAALGILIVLSAWLIVDFVMKVLYNQNLAGFGPWNTILSGGDACVRSKENQALFSGSIGFEAGLGTGVDTSGIDIGGGTCQVQSSGACATANFSTFGSAADQASEICFAESKGNANQLSGSDKLGDGTPYSVGLFQINITGHKVAGLDCPSAFNNGGKSCTVSSCGPGSGVKVVNADLYNKCVAAAKVVANNIEVAHQIYLDAHARWSPWGTAKGCGLADAKDSEPLAFGIMSL